MEIKPVSETTCFFKKLNTVKKRRFCQLMLFLLLLHMIIGAAGQDLACMVWFRAMWFDTVWFNVSYTNLGQPRNLNTKLKEETSSGI
jgi:hypothetical protein